MQQTGFWQVAARAPARPAIIDADGDRIDYGALAAAVNRLSHALRVRGLRRGDAVAMVADNTPALFQVYLAALQSGCYYVPINYHCTADDIAYIVDNAECALVFHDQRHADAVHAGLDAAGFPRTCRIALDGGGAASLAALCAGQPATRPAETPAGSLMQYTSGTTGRPKGVRRPLPARAADEVAAASALQLQWYGMAPDEGCHLVTSPLYHSAVFSHALSALNLGHGIALMSHWDEREFLRLVEATGAASTHVVATHFHRLLGLPEDERRSRDLSTLRFVIHGAVPTPIPLKQAMIGWLGPVVYEYYGSSEVGATLVTPQEWLQRPGTVGRPLAITRLRILDDDGNALPPGRQGWIYMKQGEEMFRYHKDEAKTRKASRDGFTCVGDIGYIDNDGYLFLCGRDSEIIISGGVNIYPAAAEACLLAHPAVLDAGVIGVPDDEYGEQVKAVVSLRTGWRPELALAEALITHCRAGLSRIDCPKSVDFVGQLPRDPSGKLLKRRLRDPYWVGRERQI